MLVRSVTGKGQNGTDVSHPRTPSSSRQIESVHARSEMKREEWEENELNEFSGEMELGGSG